MANKSGQYHLALESDVRWKQFKMLQIASLFAFILIFIPLLALVYVVIISVYTSDS